VIEFGDVIVEARYLCREHGQGLPDGSGSGPSVDVGNADDCLEEEWTVCESSEATRFDDEVFALL
jgi:hypothetical protein